MEALAEALFRLSGRLAMSGFLDNDENHAAHNKVVRAWVELRDREISDGWIEWNGGECPVLDCVRVDVRFRDGREVKNRDPGGWNWDHVPSPHRLHPAGDIIAYRLSDAPA